MKMENDGIMIPEGEQEESMSMPDMVKKMMSMVEDMHGMMCGQEAPKDKSFGGAMAEEDYE